MAQVQHTCTGCIPIDAKIIDTYIVLINTNKSVTAAEASRVTAEDNRVLAESGRVSAEEDRSRAESGRVDAESLRVSAEETRQSNERDRQLGEENRNSQYVVAEGTSESEAGDGSRWGAYKSAEASRDAISAEDHRVAVADHGTASDDHLLAVSDHGTAGEDHDASTRATVRASAAAEAAEHMVDIKQGPPGPQGNTGSSVDYPYELVNNLTTDDATKGLTAAQGKVLDGKVSQLEAKVFGIVLDNKAISSAGTEVDADGYYATIFIPVYPGDAISYLGGFSASSLGNGYSLVAYRADKTTRVDYWGAQAVARSITAPANTAFIRATFLKNSSFGNGLSVNGVEVPILGRINELEAEIQNGATKDANLQDQIDTINGVAILGKGVSGLGALIDNPRLIATVLIPAKPNDVVDYLGGFSGSGDTNWSMVAYKSDGTTRVNNWAATTYNRNITLPNNTAYIRATFYKDSQYGNALSINNKSIPILGTINEKVEEFFDANSLSSGDMFKYVVAKNVFGDVLPPLFKQKFYPADKDILVACQGDSLTGLVERTSLQTDPTHCPPGQQYRAWVTLLQERVSKIKPMCDRLDSKRNNADFFAKTGTWENVVEIEREAIYYSDSTTYGQERSVSALTFQCDSNSAAVSFVFDADAFDKCNIVFSKEPDGVLTKVVIAEGNGKMLASLDRTNWVEANGLQVTQRTFDNSGNDVNHYDNLNSFTNACAGDGIATRERHRRIWMKKVEGVTGEINISYQRDNTTPYSDSYMYVWGVERYSGNAIFFDNIGRGGRETDKLAAAVSDVFDRNPDLCIYEMPLANETDHTLETLKGSSYYGAYFLGTGGNSFKTRSNNYADVPILVVLPHGRDAFFDDENNAIAYSDQPSGEPVAYNFYKQMYGWLMGQMASYQNVKLINLYDQLINEILAKGYTIKDGTLGESYAITADGIHLNDYGSLLWMAYLAPLFQ